MAGFSISTKPIKSLSVNQSYDYKFLQTMIYRKLEAKDYPTYEVLRSFALDFAPTAFGSTNSEEEAYRKERFLVRVNHPLSFILGAFDQDELVGMIGFIAFERIKTRHKGDFFSMIVNPEYHRKGIGSELVNLALEKAFSYDYVSQINLSVEANNQAAIGLYQKVGFEEWGREKNALNIDGEMFDLIYMGRGK